MDNCLFNNFNAEVPESAGKAKVFQRNDGVITYGVPSGGPSPNTMLLLHLISGFQVVTITAITIANAAIVLACQL